MSVKRGTKMLWHRKTGQRFAWAPGMASNPMVKAVWAHTDGGDWRDYPPEDEVQAVSEQEESDMDESDEDVPLKDLHWRTLKKRVEDAGGAWTDKDSAIKFLEALENDPA